MEPSRYFIRRVQAQAPGEIEIIGAPVPFAENEPLVDWLGYWRGVRKHLHLIAAVVLGIIGVVAARVMTQTPSYVAETTILIEPDTGQGSKALASLMELHAVASNEAAYVRTQCAVLQSRNLALRVVRELGLEHDPAFGEVASTPGVSGPLQAGDPPTGGLATDIDRAVSAPEEMEPGITQESEATLAVVHRYLEMLTVSPVPDTSLVKISFTTADARMAARLANAHVAAYDRHLAQMRGRRSEEAERFFARQAGRDQRATAAVGGRIE
jgi:uncharacterized protein involved in exopolysaccharide biosynthesis